MKLVFSFSAVMFHHFHGGPHPIGQGSISGSQLESIINYLYSNFTLISSDTWIDKFINKELDPSEICLTFDDNLKCQFDIAKPILDKYNLKGFWFVYTSPYNGEIEKIELYRYFRSCFFQNFFEFYFRFCGYLKVLGNKSIEIFSIIDQFDTNSYLSEQKFYSKEDRIFRYLRDIILSNEEYEIIMDKMIADSNLNIEKVSNELWIKEKDLKLLAEEGHILGLHSHSHPYKMQNSSIAFQKREYEINKNILESITEKKVYSMSHPCGSYSNDTLQILNNLEIKVGFKDTMGFSFDLLEDLKQPRLDHCYLFEVVK